MGDGDRTHHGEDKQTLISELQLLEKLLKDIEDWTSRT
jgi:hypothetical protein